jgi:midasin (ATPase involved in ribosome maturation)
LAGINVNLSSTLGVDDINSDVLTKSRAVRVGALKDLRNAVSEAAAAAAAARTVFQWVDGPLVTAMRQGDIILIDELNLAEDAVLERMNRCVRP